MKKIIIAIILFLTLSHNSNAKNIRKKYNSNSPCSIIKNKVLVGCKAYNIKQSKKVKPKIFPQVCGISTGAYSSSFQMDCPNGSTYTVYDIASYIEVTFCENGVPLFTGIIVTELDIVDIGGC